MIVQAASPQGLDAHSAVTRGERPLVGFPSNRNTLRVRQLADRLVCDVALSPRAFLVVLAAVFGPALTLLLASAPRGLNPHLPLFIKLVLWATTGGMWLLLFTTLFSPRRLEVLRSTGDILWF